MHPYTKKLISQINEILSTKPLIYFSRDIERGLGLEKYLDNYYLASIEDSYIVSQLENKKKSIFSLNRKGIQTPLNSTQELINSAQSKKWIESISNNFYAQLFQFNQSSVQTLENLGGTILNNHSNLNRKFEDKLTQYEILKREGIPVPNAEVKILEKETLGQFLNKTSLKINHSHNGPLFIAQLNRAHTGAGTFFIRDTESWEELVRNHAGNEIKFSEYIYGQSYTINGCITKKGVFVAGLQYQITGLTDLTPGEGSTVGNDFSYGNNLNNNLRKEIFHITKNIGERMHKDGYRGLFGIDLVVHRNDPYVIEINARQTANIPFQTKLEILQNKIPLALINLAEWLGIEIDVVPFEKIEELEGAQIFLRSRKDNLIISQNIKSGIYRLQSDNAAKLAKDEDVILLDEEGDKPLIWQHDGYSVEDIKEGGFILLIQKYGNKRNKFDEIARMQFKNQIMLKQNNKVMVSPWIYEAMKEILERVS